MNLTYCIDSRGMDGITYSYVEYAMTTETQQWEFYTDIDFIHLKSEDSNCHNANINVVFNVRVDSSKGEEAQAFFPSNPRVKREIIIGGGFVDIWNIDFPVSLYGVICHELGHVLGLRHEHIRDNKPGGVVASCREDSNYEKLTPFDFYSVMNYAPCVGQEWFELFISGWDIESVKILYDNPLSDPGDNPPPPAEQPDLSWMPAVLYLLLN